MNMFFYKIKQSYMKVCATEAFVIEKVIYKSLIKSFVYCYRYDI